MKKLKSFLFAICLLLVGVFFVYDFNAKYAKNFGIEIPQDKKMIVGVWRSDDSVIEVTKSGKWLSKITNGAVSKTYNAKIQEITDKNIRIGMSVMGHKFTHFGLPEKNEDGKLVWNIAGRTFTHSGSRLPASERNEIR